MEKNINMREKPESKRKIRAIETKRNIQETAYELFNKYGFENVSIDNIVEAAGVSKGTFYVHFESKDALTVSFIHDNVKMVDQNYKNFIDSLHSELTTYEILYQLVGKIADIIVNVIGYTNMKTIYKIQLTNILNAASVFSYNRELYFIFSDIINKGIQQGQLLSDISAEDLAKHCVLALRGITYEWCIRYPDFDLKEQYLRHFEILLKGFYH